MPKVRLHFDIRGWCSCIVDVPQSVIDEYKRQVDSDDPDCPAIDKMLDQYICYDGVLDQLDNPEDIELTELKTEGATLAE